MPNGPDTSSRQDSQLQSLNEPEVFSPGFQQVLTACLDREIERVSRILAESNLHCCEFDDEFGCGAIATVTDLESEREYCPKHFRCVSLWRAVAEVSR